MTNFTTLYNDRPLKAGDTIIDFKGRSWIYLKTLRRPEPGLSGKILVHDPEDREWTMTFYDLVFEDLTFSTN